MSGERDPRRLLDEGGAPGELRSLLRAGKSEVPNDAQMLALAAKLGALGGLGGAGAAGAGGAGAKGAAGAGAAIKAGLAVKVIGAVALIGVAGGGAVMVSRQSAQTVVAPVGIVASAAQVASAAPITSASEAPVASAAPSASAAPIASATTASRPVESPEAEVKLLERAQDALRTSPDEALALSADHAKRFPSGMLVQEREVIAVEALVKTGRRDEARARADRFKTRFPGSSHTRRLEALLANGPATPR